MKDYSINIEDTADPSYGDERPVQESTDNNQMDNIGSVKFESIKPLDVSAFSKHIKVIPDAPSPGADPQPQPSTAAEDAESIAATVVDDNGMSVETWFRNEMASSGITEQLASDLGWVVADKALISSILGFNPPCGNYPVEGFIIPYPDPETGEIIDSWDSCNGYCRVRLRWPAQMTDPRANKIKPAKYLSPKKTGVQPYILRGVHEWLMANPEAPMLSTEGEKKVVSAFSKNLPIVGIPGIWCWSDGAKNLHPALIPYLKDRTQVIMIYDSDALDHNKKLEFVRCSDYLANALSLYRCSLRVWVVPNVYK